MNKYIESVSHLKKKLEKGVSYEKTTGIGKTVRNLSKEHIDNDIGKTAKLLCLTWKAIVKEQQEQEDCQQEYEEPEVKQEPNLEKLVESDVSRGYERSDHKIKNEYNESDEELSESNADSKSDLSLNHKRKRYNEEKSSHESKSDKKHRKHKSSHKSRESGSNGSQTEFETLLGLSDQIIKNKKNQIKRSEPEKSEKSEKSSKKSNNNLSENSNSYLKSEKIELNDSKSHSSHSLPKALDSKSKLKSLEHSDILSSLPTHNYKPLPNRELIDERVEANRRKTLKPSEDLSLNVQSKKGRTAVFAGQARNKFYTHVHSLEELCIRVLMDNIDKLCCLGDAPYYLMKPVLQKCNPKQLSRIVKHNPQISEDCDELWQEFCKKEFRGREPDDDEDENWMQLYDRCGQEREERLKNITKHITHRQAKALPVRQTQFSENVKTPREILRKQERSGISHPIAGSSSSYSATNSSANLVKIVPEKPKVAPLMKKALKLQKARYRR